jgi:hypothetical protein
VNPIRGLPVCPVVTGMEVTPSFKNTLTAFAPTVGHFIYNVWLVTEEPERINKNALDGLYEIAIFGVPGVGTVTFIFGARIAEIVLTADIPIEFVAHMVTV